MEKGMIVEHILSKDWLLILAVEEDGMLVCRKKADLGIVFINPFEVRERK